MTNPPINPTPGTSESGATVPVPTPAPTPNVDNTVPAEEDAGNPAFGGNDANESQIEQDPMDQTVDEQPPPSDPPLPTGDLDEGPPSA